MAEANELFPRIGPVQDKKFVATYQRKIEVIADSASWSGRQAIAFANTQGAGIILFASHPEETAARLINFRAEQVSDDSLMWHITLDYSTAVEIGEDGQPQSQQHPLERKAKVSYRTRKYTESILNTITGHPIRNFALDPLQQDIERARTVIQISRNLPFGDAFGGQQPLEDLIIENYVGTTNATTFLGKNPREVLLDDFDTELEQESGVVFWATNATFAISRITTAGTGSNATTVGGWVSRKLNAGYRELINGKWVTIFDQYGQRPTRPQLLDGSGRKMEPGTPATPAIPIWLEDRKSVV